MELVREGWSIDDYNDFINYLFEIRNIEYRDFYSRLGINCEIIGIKTTDLKRIAKDIFKGNYCDFLELLGHEYYEEIVLYGFIICNIKELDDSIRYLELYKSRINNWASCDLFCSSYKIIKRNKKYFWVYINDNVKSNNLWVRRMCFVFILSYYIEEEYLDVIFKLCDEYNTDDYYVEMAVAWLISICYIKFPVTTTDYIKSNKLNDFTHNKAIQKIRESYRVSREDKEYLKKLKRK